MKVFWFFWYFLLVPIVPIWLQNVNCFEIGSLLRKVMLKGCLPTMTQSSFANRLALTTTLPQLQTGMEEAIRFGFFALEAELWKASACQACMVAGSRLIGSIKRAGLYHRVSASCSQ